MCILYDYTIMHILYYSKLNLDSRVRMELESKNIQETQGLCNTTVVILYFFIILIFLLLLLLLLHRERESHREREREGGA